MKKILVTGATGPLGSSVVESLLKKVPASSIAILARNADKAAGLAKQGVEIREGDYDNYASLVTAFKGIDKLYFVSGNDTAHRMSQHDNVVRAAKEAGVQHVVYTSIPHADDFSASPIAFVVNSHVQTEKLLQNAGFTYTILQHGLYTDMIPVFAGPQLLETKTIYLPAGEGRVAAAVRADMGEAGANVLLDTTGKYDNKILQLTGPEDISFADAARYISDATGQTISYYSPSAEEFTTTLTSAGLPGHVVHIITAFASAIRIGELQLVTSHLEELLGRKPTSAEAFLKAVYHI